MRRKTVGKLSPRQRAFVAEHFTYDNGMPDVFLDMDAATDCRGTKLTSI